METTNKQSKERNEVPKIMHNEWCSCYACIKHKMEVIAGHKIDLDEDWYCKVFKPSAEKFYDNNFKSIT